MARLSGTPAFHQGDGKERRSSRLAGMEDFLRYLAASLFGSLVLFCLVGIPSVLLVTSTYGLGETIRKKAEETLGGQFYRVSVERVLFSPMRGFVLDHLQIHDRTSSRRLLVSADRLAVSFNMDSLMRGQPKLERIFLRDATLDIPLGQEEEPRLRLDHVRGLILCPPEQFQLTAASFDVDGIRVHASGTFYNPKKFSPKPVSPQGPGKTAQTIDNIQRELHSVKWGSGQPVLLIEAGGDLSDSEKLRVEHAKFQSGPGEWHGIVFKQIDMDISYNNRKLSMEKLSFNDGVGILQLIGHADFLEDTASVEVAGDFNAGALPRLFLPQEQAAEWIWIDPVRVSGGFAAHWNAGPPVLEGLAQIESGHFSYRGMAMDSFSGGIALHDGKVLVRDFHAAGDPGTLDADLLIAPGDNRLKLKASLYPAKIAPAATGKTAETLSAMDFKDPLSISLEVGAPGTDPQQFKGGGSLDLGKAAMRGAWIDSLSSKFQIANGAVDFRDIVVRIGEDAGRGEFVYDYKNWEGRFPGVRSTLDPVKVMTWIDPRIATALKDYRFIKPPDAKLFGKVGLRNPEKNDLHIDINAPSGLGYTLLSKNLDFGATSGTVLLKGLKLEIDIPQSKLFGGDVALNADVSVAPGDSRYGASIHVDDVDFKDLTTLYFDYNSSSGKLTANYAFRTVGGDDRAMVGRGNLWIKNGNVLAMPILGPLSLLLNEIVPGFGYQSAKKATCDFTVENGAINTRNLLIQGTGFSMIGHGNIYYLEDRMNMDIRLNAQGLPGLLTFPISKIFEYESVGSAKHPKWRPRLLPKGFSSKEHVQQSSGAVAK